MTPVPRLAVPRSEEEFWSRHVEPGQPAIFLGVFRGSGLGALATEQAAVSKIGDMPLMTQWSYGAALGMVQPPGSERPGFEQLSLRNYLAIAVERPDTPRMCMEQPLPDALRSLVALPACCGRDDDTEVLLFVGNRGNFALLHFDADHRHVLLHQVFGRKSVVLLPPAAGDVVTACGNCSTVSGEDLRVLARHHGGWTAELAPGETLFIPALWWHHVVYVDTGLSFNVRFGRNDRGRFLHRHVFPDVRLQAVGSLFLPRRRLHAANEAGFERLRECCDRRFGTPEDRHAAITHTLAELCRELMPGRGLNRGARPENAREESAAVAFYRSRMVGRPSARKLERPSKVST